MQESAGHRGAEVEETREARSQEPDPKGAQSPGKETPGSNPDFSNP